MPSDNSKIALERDSFLKAWMLLKEKKEGVDFTKSEQQFILTSILKMMNSGDSVMEEEASKLYHRYMML
tara:strand:- start:135 stop:341 length:207 start_codon:yes stop_codon:yes gene_type:complete